MRATSTIPLNNWYGITVVPGVEFDVPEHLVEKAMKMDFIKPVRKKKKNAKDGD